MSKNDEANRDIEMLSIRQLECLTMAADGLTSKEIALRIRLSPSTVDNHIRAATARLRVSGRRDAVRLLLRNDIVGHRDSSADATVAAQPADAAESGAPTVWRRWRIPPMGGRRNDLTQRQRLFAVVEIALLATVALAAITFTIMGVIQVLSK